MSVERRRRVPVLLLAGRGRGRSAGEVDVIGSYLQVNYFQRWFDGDTTVEQLRELLAGYRREGMAFAQAWALAISSVKFRGKRQQVEWLRAWADPVIRREWENAYNRLPTPAAEWVATLEDMGQSVAYDENNAVERLALSYGIHLPGEAA